MRTRPFRSVLTCSLPFLHLLAAACDAAPAAGPQYATRDSAGVAIWEHPDLSTVSAQTWTLGEHPILVLGEEGGDEALLFSRIRGVIPTTGGGVAVADGLSNEIRFFDESGRHLETAGGSGSGPGEFTRLRNAYSYRGDSLVATNVPGSALTVFGPGGELGRSIHCEPARPTLAALWVDGTLEGGAFLARAMEQFQSEAPTEGYHREASTYQICHPDGSAGPVLAEVPDLELGTVVEEGRYLSFPLAMGRKAVSAAAGDAVFVGVTDRLELRRYGADGTLTGILSVGTVPTAMSDEIRDRWTGFRLEEARDEDEARQLRRRYGELPWPDSLPVFSDLKGDSEGNLWVRRFTPDYAEEPGEWWVFSPDGAFRARAVFPRELRIADIGPDVVLGVMADELGVERVVRYRLERGGLEPASPD